ncbi:EmrB/QacA family drug resistance transporter [Caballeronia udeis]|uniref:EmrB/QacA family drug resistance transporter n=1 Tax=Caballeronia udeis TaxID=1232866 RepID=A0A158J6F0_9BURK|nr:EmrB/QacA family drug resistance transporter [Caballeronia udeis]
MQEYLGYRALDAGFATAPLGFFAVLGAPIMGRILPRSDARILATCAFIGFAIVYYMRSYFYTDIDVGHIVNYAKLFSYMVNIQSRNSGPWFVEAFASPFSTKVSA